MQRIWNSKWTRTCLMAALAALMTAGCGDMTDEEQATGPGTRRQSINGVITWNTEKVCSTDQKDKIEQAMAHVMDNLLHHPTGFKNCLRSALMTRDNGVSPDAIFWLLRDNMPTTIGCQDSSKVACCGGVKNWNAYAPLNEPEQLVFDTTFVDTKTARRVAGVLVHEVAHNKGFSHPRNGQYGYNFTVNEQVESCMQFGTPTASRDSMPNETETSHVGGSGGTPFGINADRGAYLNGVYVGLGSYNGQQLLRRLRGHQTPVNGGSSRWSPHFGRGATPTTWATRYCPQRQVITGIMGSSDTRIKSLSIRCTPIMSLRVRSEAGSHWFWVGGGSTGHMYLRRCPTGMAVKAFRGRYNTNIDQVRLVCQRVSLPLAEEHYRARSHLTLAGRWTGKHTTRQCLGLGAMVGLYGRTGSEINSLGGECKTTWRDTLGRVRLRTANKHVLPAEGATSNGSHFVERCPTNFALHGIRTRAGARVYRVQGLCVKTTRWRANTTPGPLDKVTIGAHGGSGGSTRILSCPRGKFVVGLDTLTKKGPFTQPSVHGLRVICRTL